MLHPIFQRLCRERRPEQKVFQTVTHLCVYVLVTHFSIKKFSILSFKTLEGDSGLLHCSDIQCRYDGYKLHPAIVSQFVYTQLCQYVDMQTVNELNSACVCACVYLPHTCWCVKTTRCGSLSNIMFTSQ